MAVSGSLQFFAIIHITRFDTHDLIESDNGILCVRFHHHVNLPFET